MNSVVIGKLSVRAGHAPRLTKSQFKEKYSPRIVGDQDEAWEVYKKEMLPKPKAESKKEEVEENGDISKKTNTDS